MSNIIQPIKQGISKTRFVIAIALCAIIMFSMGYAMHNAVLNKRHQPIGPSANVFVTVQTEFGVYDIATGNVITNIGERYVRNILGFDNVTAHNATKWITLSNDASPVQTWTKLPTEATTYGAGRALGTVSAWVSAGDYSYNVTKKFTFTGSITLQCTGTQWSGVASSDNNLFACAAFTQTAFANNWNLTIKWSFVYNAND